MNNTLGFWSASLSASLLLSEYPESLFEQTALLSSTNHHMELAPLRLLLFLFENVSSARLIRMYSLPSAYQDVDYLPLQRLLLVEESEHEARGSTSRNLLHVAAYPGRDTVFAQICTLKSCLEVHFLSAPRMTTFCTMTISFHSPALRAHHDAFSVVSDWTSSILCFLHTVLGCLCPGSMIEGMSYMYATNMQVMSEPVLLRCGEWLRGIKTIRYVELLFAIVETGINDRNGAESENHNRDIDVTGWHVESLIVMQTRWTRCRDHASGAPSWCQCHRLAGSIREYNTAITIIRSLKSLPAITWFCCLEKHGSAIHNAIWKHRF